MRSAESTRETGPFRPDPGPAGPPPEEGANSSHLVRLALVFYAGLFAAAWLWRSALGGESLLFADAEAAAVGLRPLRDLGIGVGAGLVLVVASRLWTRWSRRGAELSAALAELLGPLPLGAVALLAVTSGVAEEAFFRGALQPRVGLLLASVLFGLAHYVPRRGFVAWAPSAMIAGLVLGELFRVTGNLVAPAVAHGVVNAINLHWLARRRAPGPGRPDARWEVPTP